MERVNRRGCHWTQREVAILEDLLDEGRSLSRIAATLGRTVDAVARKRRSLGLAPPTARDASVHETARRLGVTRTTLKAFLARRWLVARPPVRRGSSMRVIETESVREFLWDEAHWHEIDPRQIVDPTWQAWATDARGGLTFLTPDEAARVLGLSPAAVCWRIKRGRIRAARTVGGLWMIRSDWLQEAPRDPPPWTFTKRPFTAEEDAFLRLWRPFTPICHLAAALGRSEMGVRKRCRRLGLTGPVIPQNERHSPSRRGGPRKVA